MSKRFVIAYLALLAAVVAAYIVLAYISVYRNYQGGLYYLQWPLTALSAAGAVILAAYFNKSKAENTKGGITYDAAITKEDTGI